MWKILQQTENQFNVEVPTASLEEKTNLDLNKYLQIPVQIYSASHYRKQENKVERDHIATPLFTIQGAVGNKWKTLMFQ